MNTDPRDRTELEQLLANPKPPQMSRAELDRAMQLIDEDGSMSPAERAAASTLIFSVQADVRPLGPVAWLAPAAKKKPLFKTRRKQSR